MVAASPGNAIRVERWPSERPLAAIVWLTALALWFFIALSVIGILYAVFLGLFFFLAHLAFIAHLRGNAVRLSAEQLPELHERVRQLSARIGLDPVPDAYLLQSGGALNALATRFLGTNLIVLYSDLLEACGENEAARDFIVAHELGHLHAGHLRWSWLLIPGLAMPFLGHAYSRAREYTCDRYGIAASVDRERALDGLSVLAAGAGHAPRVNRRALVAQRADLESGFMKLGSWLFTHPSIAHRLAALEPSLGDGHLAPVGGRIRALALAALLAAIPVGGFAASLWVLGKFGSALAPSAAPVRLAPPEDRLRPAAEAGLSALAAAVEDHQARFSTPPADLDALYAHWATLNPDEPEPRDPYDGLRFGYVVTGASYSIMSAGPSPESSDDDITWDSDVSHSETLPESGNAP